MNPSTDLCNKAAGIPEIDLFFDLARVLPHTIQLRIGESPMAWEVLSSQGLVAASADFVLKFGGSIPADWVAIGILDAVPDLVINPEVTHDVSDLDQVASVLLGHLEPLIRQFLGRPSTAYGITPLAVFREVGARPN